MENKKNNKGLIIAIVCGLIGIVLIIGIVVGISISNNDEDDDDYTPRSKENINEDDDEDEEKDNDSKLSEEKIEKILEKIGESWYEGSYYPEVGRDSVSRYEDIGIKLTLETLSQSLIDKSMLTKKELEYFNKAVEVCDNSKTKIIIYPEDDFGKKDYDIESVIVFKN